MPPQDTGASTPAKSARKRVAPRQERSIQTYEHLLDVAGHLLAEVGVEQISTNLICARANMTPPALYRYFDNKYAVLAALGKRLLDRQNVVLYAWLDTYAPKGLRAMGEATEELLLKTHEVTRSQPGAIWTLRALRAVPQLAQVRIDSHREAADRMVKAYAPLLPDMAADVLWRRVRISIELGYSADEMLFEEGRLEVSDIIKDTAAVLKHALLP